MLGALLFARFVQWIGRRYRANLDEQVRESIEQGLVASEEAKRSRAVAEVIEWAVISLTYFVAAILAIRQLGIPLTTLVAPATVVGVALGFGAQQVVGDLLAGFFLFSERQFGIGDLIRLSQPGQATGVTGTVEQLTLRVTKLRTASGEFVVVPEQRAAPGDQPVEGLVAGGARHPGARHRGPRPGHLDAARGGRVAHRGRGVGRAAARQAGRVRRRDDRGRLRAAAPGGAHAARVVSST